MAEKSAIQRIKDLDTERASIFDQAKEEALEKAKAAVAELNGNTSPLAETLRLQFQTSFLQANNGSSPGTQPRLSSDGLHARAVGAARRALLAMRASGEIGDDAFHRLEEELDRIELSAT